MKNRIFLAFCLGLLMLQGFPSGAAIYRLGWWGQPVPNKDFRWDQYADLEALASANDTVQVYDAEGQNNPYITVAKPLRFIGFGFLRQVNSTYQYYRSADRMCNITLAPGSDGSVLQGLSCSGINIQDVSNITIRFCRIGNLDLTNSNTISNINIIGNWFQQVGYSGAITSSWWATAAVTNFKCVNNLLSEVNLGGGSSGIIANNVFLGGISNFDINNFSASNILVKNNIVTNPNIGSCFFLGSSGVIRNNLFAYAQAQCPSLTGNGNVYGVNMSITFQNWNNGVLAGDSSLRIPAGSPAINAGVNNALAPTNCGIYGGETAEVYRQSGIPQVPAVFALSTPNLIPSGTSMACTTSVRSNNASNVTRVEYYVDSDPGYGLGTAVTITAGTTISNATFNVALSALSQGPHYLVVRARDAGGNWSLNNMLVFVKAYSTVGSVAAGNVTRVEYYIDHDPGMGLATSLSITPGTNLNNLTIPVNPTNLSEGMHTVYVRSRDANGKWSLTNAWTLMKPYNTVPAVSAGNINRVEYYIDTDPGYGSATALSITPGTDISNLTVPVNPGALSEGIHNACVRSRDASGRWSLSNTWTFMKPYNPVAAGIRPKLTKMEYYIDIDPGYGAGVPVAINADTAIASKGIAVNMSGLSTGSHTVWVRSMDSLGRWSLDNKRDFNLTAAQPASSIVTNSVSKYTHCSGATFQVGYHAKGTYNAGNVFSVQLSSSTGSFASPTVIGTLSSINNGIINCTLPSHLTTGSGYKIRVVSSSPAITGLTIADSLTIRDRPYAQTITGPSAGNVNTAYSYSVPTVSGSTWQWIVPAANVTPNANAASITWATAGLNKSIKVVQTNTFGCIGDTSTKSVNIYTPALTAAVPSATNPCKGSAFSVSTNATGVFTAGNLFTVQLSNAAGSFASPTTIGSLSSAPSGSAQAVNISVVMPSVPNGAGYKVRVVSSTPALTGAASAASITVSNPNMGNDTVVSKCSGSTYNLTTLYSASGITYQYYNSSFVLLPTPSAVNAGSYRAIGTGSTGCKDTTVVTVSDLPKPSLGNDQVIAKCAAETYNLSALFTNPALSYQYYSGAWVNVGTPAAVQAGTYQVVGTNASGCKDTAQVIINNNNTPNLGPDQVKYYLVNTTYNLTTLYTNPVFTYSYRRYDWTAVPNPASVTAGVYYIIATYNTCKDTVKITVKLGKPGLLGKLQATDSVVNGLGDLLIYPNPARHTLHVEWLGSGAGQLDVTVHDMAGKVLLRRRWENQAGPRSGQLEVGDLATGIYLLRIQDGSGQAQLVKFVKE